LLGKACAIVTRSAGFRPRLNLKLDHNRLIRILDAARRLW
jgi:hypothetical protein